MKLKCWENLMDSLQEICIACGEKCRPSGDSKIYYLNLFCQGIRNEGFRWLNLRFIFYLGFMWCYLYKLYKELKPQFCMVLRIPHISELLQGLNESVPMDWISRILDKYIWASSDLSLYLFCLHLTLLYTHTLIMRIVCSLVSGSSNGQEGQIDYMCKMCM